VIPSMVPGEAAVLIDRRMVPGETASTVVESLRRSLADGLPGVRSRVSIVEAEGVYEPAEIDADGATAKSMVDAVEMYGIEPVIFGTPYSSDVRHLINSAGVEAITFGPGRFADMHARDEMIDVDELSQAARAVAAFCSMTWTEGQRV
jgi:succinyl-diaminopimelate desuccinylase